MFLSHDQDRERGAVSFLFIFLAPIVIGVISYSLYVGQQIDLKIETQNSSDASVFSMTGHATQGLNMISANNLAIGGALHVAGAVPILAAYGSIAYAMSFDATDSLITAAKDMASLLTLGAFNFTDDFQKNVWNHLAVISSNYLRTAVGLTSFNQFISDYWLIPAPIRAIEMARLNTPDSIVLPLQKSLINSPSSGLKYQGLKVTTSKEALCKTLRSSEGVTDRDVISTWITGPLKTLGMPPGLSSVISGLENLNRFINKYAAAKITFVGCGYGMKSPILKFIKDISAIPTLNGGVLAQVGRGVNSSALVLEAVNSDQVNPTRSETKKILFRSFPVPCEGIIATVALRNSTSSIGHVFSEDFVKKALFSKALRAIVEDVNRFPVNKSPYTCDEELADGTIKKNFDSMPFKRPNGDQCINLRNLGFYCPLKKYIKPLLIPIVGDAVICADTVYNQMKEWKAQCDWYDDIENNGGEFQIVDWGKQIDAYLTVTELGRRVGGAVEVGNRDFGFTYIDDKNAFADSVDFASLVARSADFSNNTDALSCKPEFEIKGSDGKTYCQDKRMVGLAPVTDAGIFQTLKNQKSDEYTEELHSLSSGVTKLVNDNSDALASSWGRSLWTLSYSKAMKIKPAPDQAQLFWPNWYPEMKQSDRGFFEGILKYVLPSDPETGSTVAFLSLFQ